MNVSEDDLNPLLRRADEAKKHGGWREAAGIYGSVVKRQPQRLGAYIELAFCLQQLRDFQAAFDACAAAARIDPNYVDAYANMGNLSRLMARADDAMHYFEHARALENDYAELHNSLATVYKDVGRLDDALTAYRRAEALRPSPAVGSNILYASLFADAENAPALRDLHIAWAEKYAKSLLNKFDFAHHDRDPNRRLRIGYVSPYFKNHAVNFFVQPILTHHDRNTVEVFCYSDVDAPDAVTNFLRAGVEHWVDARNLSDDALAAKIYEDRIDVLVDLTGHIARHRLLVFARKPAPITVTYIGYQFTTGLPNMDYRLTDALADPPGQTDAFYTERLWRLPRCFFTYAPSASSPEISPLPADRNGFITFGCQNHFSKFSDCALRAWAGVLEAVPNSKLVLLVPDCEWSRMRVLNAMRAASIDLKRLQLVSRATRREYLARNNQLDIALDPIPFNGHTTTCDSLWCGVPVIARLGTQYVSRYGSSALANLGLLNELSGEDEAQFVERAKTLANNRDRLRELRATLRQQMAKSAVCDHAGFTRRLEGAYRQMCLEFLKR